MTVDANGFAIKTQAEIETEIKQAFAAQFGNKNLLATSVLGQIISIVAQYQREAYEVAQAVYSSFNPNAASGQALDNLASLSGVTRLSATATTATVTLNLDAATTVPSGTLFSNPGTGDQFALDSAVTSTTAGNYTGQVTCTETGPKQAVAGSIDTVDTPVAGLNSVTNAADAAPGRDRETDAELRLRRAQSIALSGKGTPNAIRADLLDVADVTEAIVLANPSDITDATGVPSKAVRAIVRDGADQDIVNALGNSVAGGTQTFGSTSGTFTTSDGQAITYYFDRPTAVDIYVEVDAATTSDYVAGTIEAAIAAAEAFTIGEDVFASKLYETVLDVAGVTDCTITVGTSASPTGTTVSIAIDELADFDSSRVSVV